MRARVLGWTYMAIALLGGISLPPPGLLRADDGPDAPYPFDRPGTIPEISRRVEDWIRRQDALERGDFQIPPFIGPDGIRVESAAYFDVPDCGMGPYDLFGARFELDGVSVSVPGPRAMGFDEVVVFGHTVLFDLGVPAAVRIDPATVRLHSEEVVWTLIDSIAREVCARHERGDDVCAAPEVRRTRSGKEASCGGIYIENCFEPIGPSVGDWRDPSLWQVLPTRHGYFGLRGAGPGRLEVDRRTLTWRLGLDAWPEGGWGGRLDLGPIAPSAEVPPIAPIFDAARRCSRALSSCDRLATRAHDMLAPCSTGTQALWWRIGSGTQFNRGCTDPAIQACAEKITADGACRFPANVNGLVEPLR